MVSLVISFSTASIYHSRRIVVFNELNKFKSLPFNFIHDEEIIKWAHERTLNQVVIKELRKELSRFRLVVGRKKTYDCSIVFDEVNEKLAFVAYVHRTTKETIGTTSLIKVSVRKVYPIYMGINKVELYKPWYYLFRERLRLKPTCVTLKDAGVQLSQSVPV